VDWKLRLLYDCPMPVKHLSLFMKSSIDPLPPLKQRELARVLEVLHEEFDDALKGGVLDFKKRGSVLKVILFGSCSRGSWVDERTLRRGIARTSTF